MQDAQVLAFKHGDVQMMYQQSCNWEHFGRLMAEQVYQQMNARVEMMQFLTPKQRYVRLLETQPELFNQVSNFHLSSYLGIKPESLSRIRKRLFKKQFLYLTIVNVLQGYFALSLKNQKHNLFKMN